MITQAGKYHELPCILTETVTAAPVLIMTSKRPTLKPHSRHRCHQLPARSSCAPGFVKWDQHRLIVLMVLAIINEEWKSKPSCIRWRYT